MRIAALLFTCVAAVAAVTDIQVDPNRQQGNITFKVINPAQCSITVYRNAALTEKAEDTDNSIFSGSENCIRPYNRVVGNVVHAVVGRRIVELGAGGLFYSRGLEVAHTHYVQLKDLTDNDTQVVQLVTDNIPFGDTHAEAPISPGNGLLGYPDLDWTEAGLAKGYTDPLGGLRFHRTAARMKGTIGAVTQFATVLDVGSAWTNASNARSTGTSSLASITADNTHALFLPIDSNGQKPWRTDKDADLPNDLRATFRGSGSSLTGEDRKLQTCLAVRYNPSQDVCTGAPIDVQLPTTAGASISIPSTFPKFQFNGWAVGRFLNSEEAGVSFGTAAVANSVVTMDSNSFVPPIAEPGHKVRFGSTWYTIGTIRSATSFTLSESGVNLSTGTPWQFGILGIRVWKKTATSGTTVSFNVTYELATRPPTEPHQAGYLENCSRLTVPVKYEADGSTLLVPEAIGRQCTIGANGKNKFLVLLVETGKNAGETRYLSPLDIHTDYSGGALGGPRYFNNSFDPTDGKSLIAVHGDDSYGYGAPQASNLVFYRVTYDIDNVSCRYKNYPGNNFGLSNPSDCLLWNNISPGFGHPGSTINEQIATAGASNPIYANSGLNAYGFTSEIITGNYAVFQQHVSQQGSAEFDAFFDMTKSPPQLTKFFDTLGYALQGRCAWCGVHSSNQGGNGEVALYSVGHLTGEGSNYAYRGPFRLPRATRVSFDGGSTWDTNISISPGTLVNYPAQASQCGSTPTIVRVNSNTGLFDENGVTKCVTAARVAGICTANTLAVPADRECIWLEFSTDRPSDVNPSTEELTTWGSLSWFVGGASPLPISVGDFIMRETDDSGAFSFGGKRELLRLLEKTWTGTAWRMMFQRFSGADNLTSDPSKGAAQYYDHLFSGADSNTYADGWKPMMACSPISWIQMSGTNATTLVFKDAAQAGGYHTGFGFGPDRQSLTAVSYGTMRTGFATAGIDHVYDPYCSEFHGTSRCVSTDTIESYISLSHFAATIPAFLARFWDFRHLNPNSGYDPETPLKMWTHTRTLVSGQSYTYKTDIFGGFNNHKFWRPFVFSSRFGWVDISGPGSVIDDSKPFTFCYAYAAGECRPGSSVNDVYVVAPNAYVADGGCYSNTYTLYTPCVTNWWHFAGWLVEGNSQRDNSGYRLLTMGLTTPAGQYHYTSGHMSSTGDQAFIRAGWAGGIQPDHLVWNIPPPPPLGNPNLNDYVYHPVQMPTGSGYVRVRFGYAENGADGTFNCTTRQEACLTDASVAPFAFAQTDTLTAIDCRTGCTVQVPSLPGRMLYYRVERSANGTTGWVNGITQIKSIKQ